MGCLRTVGLVLVAVGLAAAPAPAATVGGSLEAPADGSSLVAPSAPGAVFLQVQPAPRAVPSTGVITSWRADVANSAGFRLAIVTDRGSGVYRLERLSPAATIAGTGVQTVQDRIPVAAGEYAGIFVPREGGFPTPGPAGTLGVNNGVTGAGYLRGDVSTPGATFNSPLETGTMLRYDATLEADADGDGFGDLTQDACPADPARQQPPCPLPVAPAPPGPAPPPGGPAAPADTTPPTLANVVVSRGRLLFTSTEAGRLTVRLTRLREGRRRGRACVAPTRKLRRGKRCVRRGPTTTFTAAAGVGAGSAGLNAGLLRAGRYEVAATLTDAAGNRSAPVIRALSVRR
jgi:hypothetical protein